MAVNLEPVYEALVLICSTPAVMSHRSHATASWVADRAGVSEATARKHLAKLVADGRVSVKKVESLEGRNWLQPGMLRRMTMAYSVVRRSNPSLIVLSNPERVPGEHVGRRTWGKFHLKGGEKAGIQKIPDVPGMPKTVVVLGALEQVVLGDVETVFGKTKRLEFDYKRNIKGGPWLVMDTAGKTLYIVAKTPKQLAALMDACGVIPKVLSIAYWPGPNSGKHDRLAFSHDFGEGGKLPKKRWKEAWPKLIPVGKRAFELWRPAKFGYTIEDRGIVG